MKSVRIIFSVCISFICLIAHGQQVTEGSNAMLPTITQNQKGEIVLYWTEKATDNNMSLYYAVSPNNGQSFGSKVLIHKSLGMGQVDWPSQSYFSKMMVVWWHFLVFAAQLL